jgi:energy-converting hydrogenase A subunit M
MKEILYEKDLTAMKYAILVSKRHDRLVRQIAEDLSISPQKLRKSLIRRMDMILLENLPARYEMGTRESDRDAPLARAMGRALYTRFVPLVDREEMNRIIGEVRARINGGMPQPEAVAAGKRMLGEAIAG